MSGLFRKLRGEMVAQGIDRPYLAERLDKSLCYIDYRFSGRHPFTQNDQYGIMDLLGIPYERLHEYFPKGGVA